MLQKNFLPAAGFLNFLRLISISFDILLIIYMQLQPWAQVTRGEGQGCICAETVRNAVSVPFFLVERRSGCTVCRVCGTAFRSRSAYTKLDAGTRWIVNRCIN